MIVNVRKYYYKIENRKLNYKVLGTFLKKKKLDHDSQIQKYPDY